MKTEERRIIKTTITEERRKKNNQNQTTSSVSYTHLDVYKRQDPISFTTQP